MMPTFLHLRLESAGMTDRTTYEENMAFINTTVQRLERNEVGIDELETLARDFASARKFCLERITRIEAVLQQTLHDEQVQG